MSKDAVFAVMCSGMNRLTQPSLDSMLAAKKVVLGLWYSPECQKCGRELWEVNYSLFAFGYDQNVVEDASFVNSSTFWLLIPLVRRRRWRRSMELLRQKTPL